MNMLRGVGKSLHTIRLFRQPRLNSTVTLGKVAMNASTMYCPSAPEIFATTCTYLAVGRLARCGLTLLPSPNPARVLGGLQVPVLDVLDNLFVRVDLVVDNSRPDHPRHSRSRHRRAVS